MSWGDAGIPVCLLSPEISSAPLDLRVRRGRRKICPKPGQHARDDDGAGPLDVFLKQWMCKGCSSAWMNGTISCKREPGAGQYDTGSAHFPSGSLCRCVNIPWWSYR